jgi:hypothetical protein
MAGPFGATSTTDDELADIDLSGRRALVTGVSAGLGVETARALAAHGGIPTPLNRHHRPERHIPRKYRQPGIRFIESLRYDHTWAAPRARDRLRYKDANDFYPLRVDLAFAGANLCFAADSVTDGERAFDDRCDPVDMGARHLIGAGVHPRLIAPPLRDESYTPKCKHVPAPAIHSRVGAKRQAIAKSSRWSNIVSPFALGPPGRLWASTRCVTGSKQKKSASDAGE